MMYLLAAPCGAMGPWKAMSIHRGVLEYARRQISQYETK